MQINKALAEKFLAGRCTPSEAALMEEYLKDSGHQNEFLSIEEWDSFHENKELSKEMSEKIFTGVISHIRRKKRIRLWTAVSTAAALITIIGGITLTLSRIKEKKNINVAIEKSIKPGGMKAWLTTTDGVKISLNELKTGKIIEQTGILAEKTATGRLVYTAVESMKAGEVQRYNTITTPAGGGYQVILPDGTRAWLNASSSLKYPIRFAGGERKVELSGEGYFEVAHSARQPFKVVTGNQTVEVLGTHFNINAYADEQAIATTLLEGRVKISAYQKEQILKPSEQAKLSGNGFSVSQVTAESAIDWVDNDFIFDNEQLGSIMRKLSRWYNIEVAYPANLGKLTFSGSISRNKSLLQVLSTVERTGLVKFKIEGRRVTAM